MSRGRVFWRSRPPRWCLSVGEKTYGGDFEALPVRAHTLGVERIDIDSALSRPVAMALATTFERAGVPAWWRGERVPRKALVAS